MTALEDRTAVEEVVPESILERIWGLTEMFPEQVQKATATLTTYSTKALKVSWKFTRSSLWILSTSFAIGILPLVVVQQRIAFEDMMNEQRKQGLFGPTMSTDPMQQLDSQQQQQH
eukprot:TRINITY_DN11921_c0_g1_i1.p1 TRINITY_DN11921_c0_g1~~TRINITY_DN11921_c0_g1_i1.p1  ORF type:complete len:116 (+),score=22.86 TRINITY_DN11921_c0_g1_i1:78-425(+)